MPTRSDYDKAILFSQIRLKVADADLREGQVKTVRIGANEVPWGNQGGFAVVYKFQTKSGKSRALRCFTRPMNPDTKQRYELLGPYFRSHAPDITADFIYYDQGIEISEMFQGQLQAKIYPIIDMEWIEGVTLFDRVEKLCQQRDQAALGDLAKKWFEVIQKLHHARIAHGDLAAVNVMVRDDGRLVLVDYDGAYIQGFQGKQQMLYGTRGFQHPQMHQRPFDEWMDEFSSLVIFTALMALKAQPTLWGKHVKYSTQGRALDQTLLFTHEDFEQPDRSVLFSDLERSPDIQVQEAVRALKHACGQIAAQVRFPLVLGDPDFAKRLALETLKQAIANDDDEQILKDWDPLLDRYQPAAPFRPRWELAKLRVQSLMTFRSALQSRALKRILASYDKGLLDPCKNVTSDEREKLRLAQQFETALIADKDEGIVSVWMTIEQSQHRGFLGLIPAEQQRLDLAQFRKRLIDTFRAALLGGSMEGIVAAFDPAILTYPGVTPQERQALQGAQAFRKACQDDDDEAIEATATTVGAMRLNQRQLAFSAEENKRIQLAMQRNTALKNVRRALLSRRPDEIAAAYDDSLLGASTKLSQEERQKIRLAKGWAVAAGQRGDEALLKAWEAIEQSPYGGFFDFSPAEKSRVGEARQRKAALSGLRVALANKGIGDIVAAYQPVIHNHPDLTPEEREVLERVEEFERAWQHDDDLAVADAAQKIKADPKFQRALTFSTRQEERIQLATQRKQALIRFREALQSRKAANIVSSYANDTYLLDPCKSVTPAERAQLARAKRFHQMRQEVLNAIGNQQLPLIEKLQLIVKLYDQTLARQFDDFDAVEIHRINAARKWPALQQAYIANDHELIIQLHQEVEQSFGLSLPDAQLREAKRQFTSSCHPRNVQVTRLGSFIPVQWDWPSSDLIQAVAVAWRSDRFPRTPDDVQPATRADNPHFCYRENNAALQGAYTITAQYAQKVYVQVFAAMEEWDLAQRKRFWYYSDGQEPTSKKVV